MNMNYSRFLCMQNSKKDYNSQPNVESKKKRVRIWVWIIEDMIIMNNLVWFKQSTEALVIEKKIITIMVSWEVIIFVLDGGSYLSDTVSSFRSLFYRSFDLI